MQLSILHSFMGDNDIDFDTNTEEGRKKLGETLNKLLRAGTAIFLERADKTYRVTGWDPNTDQLIIQNPGRWPTGEVKQEPATDVPIETPAPTPEQAACVCNKCEGCQNKVGTRSRYSICTPCQQGKHGGRKLARHEYKPVVHASPRRGRMTAVAPTAGG